MKSVILALICSNCLAQNASMFRGNPQHTGVYEAPGAPLVGKPKWKFHTNGQIYSSPAVANGLVYFGSTDHNFYAVDAGSGKPRWVFKTEGRVVSSPAVEAGVVYFGSYDGNFYAVDALTGLQKWKFQTGGERRFAAKHLHGVAPASDNMPDPWDLYLSSPVVGDGAVFFGSGDGNTYALNLDNGKVKWKFASGGGVHASPALDEGTVYVGSWDSYFYALDATTGNVKWRFKTGEDPDVHNQVGIQSSAAIVNGTVYFGCRDSHVYAVDAHTGKQKWAFATKGSWVIASPAVRDGKVLVATSDTGLVLALDADSGQPLFTVDGKHWILFSSPAITGNLALIGTFSGVLRAIDLSSHNIAWTFETDGAKAHAAAITKPDGTPNDDLIYPGDFYDDMVSGVQTMMKAGAIVSSPVIVKDTVYLGSGDGNLYAVQ